MQTTCICCHVSLRPQRCLFHLVSIWPTGFLLFWYLGSVPKGIPRKKTRLRHFNALKSGFKVPASATPNEVDCESVQKKSLGF